MSISGKESRHLGSGDCSITQSDSFRFEDVCKPGNTLLWDLLQDPVAVRGDFSCSDFQLFMV